MVKNLVVYMLLVLALLIPSQVSTFNVDGMMCLSGCVVKVNSVVNSIDGVDKTNVNFKKGLLTVKYDPLKVNDDMIVDKLSSETTYIVKKTEKNFSKIIFNWLKIF